MFDHFVGSALKWLINATKQSIKDIEIFGNHLSGDCDFEDLISCTYTQETVEDDFDWMRGHGGTNSWRTGPTFDNTKKDGTGMTLELALLAFLKVSLKAGGVIW